MKRNVCVIGAGRWGMNHIRTLSELGCLGSIVESDRSKWEALKESYSQLDLFANIREVLDASLDGYTVCTPAPTHYEIAKVLLENGKHVLVEKPLALNLEDAEDLKALADQQGINLMVGHVLLFHPAIQKIKALIDEGKIGRLQYIYSNRLNLGTVRTEENVIWSFAPHDISVFQYLIENKPVEVLSRGGAFLQPGIHDTTMTMLTYPNNIVGHIFVSWLHPFKEHRLVVIGSEGMISFTDTTQKDPLLFYPKGIEWVNNLPVEREGPTEVIPFDDERPLTRELRYFIEHLDGSAIEMSTSQSAIEVLEIIEKATAGIHASEELSI